MNNLEEALIHYNKAILLANGDRSLFIDISKQKALLLSSMGLRDKALLVIEDCINTAKNNIADLHVIKGYIYMDAGETDEGLRQFETAITLSDNDPFIIYQIGTACYDNGEYDLAYDALRRITIENQDDNPIDGWAYYAACCAKMGRADEFLYALRKGCEVNPAEVSIVFSNILHPNIPLLIYTNSSKTNL